MHRRRARLVFAAVALGLALLGGLGRLAQDGSLDGLLGFFRSPSQEAGPGADSGEAAVARAFEERRSNLWVKVSGTVERLLRDDLEGSRHQRFILRLSSGQTLLVAHNVDLAPRAPVEVGSDVTVHGEYEWNDRGGVLHWTHHDPDGRIPGGWIRVGDEVVR